MSTGTAPWPHCPAGSLPRAGPGTAGSLTYVCPMARHGCQQSWAWPWGWPAGCMLTMVGRVAAGTRTCRDNACMATAWGSRGEAGAYALGIMAAGWVPEGGRSGCVTPSWPATALHLLVRHQATQLLVSSWWLGEPPELVLKPSLKEGVCELQLGGQCWQKLASPWPASPKGSSECWLQAGGKHAPRPQRTERLPRQAHQVPRSSIARECS